ncbi:CS domain-containing protein [Cynara cardunculus var. scolymus]|uniref:CS domain-containing protein n=1 Tax=Cynara cardunculus var. scolymus TaxID=59895 RepID=A0A103Y8Z0_CYNCS|nr:CS domain-containing protein [Cynara cardunculus var. scolymus]
MFHWFLDIGCLSFPHYVKNLKSSNHHSISSSSSASREFSASQWRPISSPKLMKLSLTTTLNSPLTSTRRPSSSTLPTPTSYPTALRLTSNSKTSLVVFLAFQLLLILILLLLKYRFLLWHTELVSFGFYVEAVSDANKAIELDPSISKGYLRKGIACFNLEEYQTAKTAFEAGASLVPEDTRFRDWIEKCEKCIAEENGELPTQSLDATPTEVVATPSQAPEEPDADPKDAEQVKSIPSEVATRMPAKPKYRHEYYQKPEEAIVTIFAKGIPAESVSVNFGEQIVCWHFNFNSTFNGLSVTIDVPGEEAYIFQPRLFGKIIPAKCRYIVLSTKIEIRLAKVEPIHWTSLEFSKDTLVVRSSSVSSGGNQRPVYPSSKPTKDWDKLEAQVKKEVCLLTDSLLRETNASLGCKANYTVLCFQEKDEKLDGDAALNKFFRDIYQDADEDTRRAMRKSFSNGTVLSTNWKEVGSKEVEGTAPDGMELRKWEY